MEGRGSTATVTDEASGVVPGALVVIWVGDPRGSGLVLARHHKIDLYGRRYDNAMVLFGRRTFDLIPGGLIVVAPALLPGRRPHQPRPIIVRNPDR